MVIPTEAEEPARTSGSCRGGVWSRILSVSTWAFRGAIISPTYGPHCVYSRSAHLFIRCLFLH